MPKAIRKNFFSWSTDEFEDVLARLLENMLFTDIRIQSGGQTAQAVACELLEYQTYRLNLRFQTSISWQRQSEGVTVLVKVEESECEWTGSTCDRLALALIGAIKTICELEHGVDD
jgi:hypothetical protein